jgi:hypothetical protein
MVILKIYENKASQPPQESKRITLESCLGISITYLFNFNYGYVRYGIRSSRQSRTYLNGVAPTFEQVSQEILQFLSVDVAGIDDLLGHLKGSVREYTAGQSVGLDLIIMKVGELGIRFGMEANVL